MALLAAPPAKLLRQPAELTAVLPVVPPVPPQVLADGEAGVGHAAVVHQRVKGVEGRPLQPHIPQRLAVGEDDIPGRLQVERLHQAGPRVGRCVAADKGSGSMAAFAKLDADLGEGSGFEDIPGRTSSSRKA